MGVNKRRIQVVSAAIVADGRYLITQRQEKAVLPLLWEFPGGKVEPGESDAQALERELDYRLGVPATIGERLSTTEKEYEKYIVELHLYRCDIGDTVPTPRKVRALEWVSCADFDRYDFTPADQESMDALLFADEGD